MIVNINNSQSALKISLDQARLIVEQVVREENCSCDEVSVYFVDKHVISRLHKKFFGISSSTDCISFPMDDEEIHDYRILGEVFVCPATAVSYAIENDLDPYEETALYIVHGLLHLMGYDDLSKEDRLKMRKAEKRHMQEIKKHHLYLRS